MKLSERTYQVIIGVLLFIIVILAWQIASGGKGIAFGGKTATTTEIAEGDVSSGTSSVQDQGGASWTPSTSVGSGEAVSVNNQFAGGSVAVASVTLSQPGWVAVRDSSGRTLGAAWFDAGTRSNVSVPLLRATEAGRNYQVLLYVDDGDREFDVHSEILITNADGSIAGTTFSAE